MSTSRKRKKTVDKNIVSVGSDHTLPPVSISDTNEIAHTTVSKIVTPIIASKDRISKKFFFNKKTAILVAIIAIGLGSCGWYQSRVGGIEEGHDFSTKQEDMIMQAVSQKIVVSDAERPRIFKVTDRELGFMGDPFFSLAKEGDIVLIYVKEGKAILWSPSRDRIVNASPVSKVNSEVQ